MKHRYTFFCWSLHFCSKIDSAIMVSIDSGHYPFEYHFGRRVFASIIPALSLLFDFNVYFTYTILNFHFCVSQITSLCILFSITIIGPERVRVWRWETEVRGIASGQSRMHSYEESNVVNISVVFFGPDNFFCMFGGHNQIISFMHCQWKIVRIIFS